MGSSKFEMNLPVFFEKKTIGNFNLDEKFFEFSDYFLIDNYSINVVVLIEKKNTFWQLDFKIKGTANTYCDRCGDRLLLDLQAEERYFLKEKKDEMESDNVIYITHSTEPVNIENTLKEVLFFIFPKTRKHVKKECNQGVLKKLNLYQKNESKILLSDHLKQKLK